MDADEFLAAIAAIHKYIQDSRERPIEIRREISYWKVLSRVIS